MSSTTSSHAIAPANVLRGSGAWVEALSLIPELCQKPFVLGRSAATAELRQTLSSDLAATGLSVAAGELEFDCCEQDLQRLAAEITASGSDAVLAAGGGKVLDAPIEIVTADHQNKPDIASNISRQWYDREQVDSIMELTTSSVALAAPPWLPLK